MSKIKKIITGFLFLNLALTGSPILFGQQSIKGRVIDAVYRGGIAGSSVFISNTSVGTVSDSNGYFVLNNIPRGKNDLIISCIGFETNVFPFSHELLPLELKVEMKSKAKELEDVVLEPYETGDYNRWKFIFFPEFIGTNINAEQCKILNPTVLKFRYYTRSNRLTAYADEPLIVENKSLGYTIYYQLETFESNQENRTTYFSGYPLFKEMDAGRSKKGERWKTNRKEAYWGSIMHFMRCIYNNTLLQEGFEVKQVKKVVNEEKERVIKIYNPVVKRKTTSMPGHRVSTDYEYSNEPEGIAKDSLRYYRRIILQHDTIAVYDPQLLTADSLVLATEGEGKVVFFNGPLYVKNNMKTVNGQPVYLWSTITLSAGKEIIVGRNGNYYNSKDMISSGSWALNERVSNMVPWDY